MYVRGLYIVMYLLWRLSFDNTVCCYRFPEGNYAQSRDHFLYASKPEDYGNMLVEFACKKGYPSEADLFIAQAVLQ